MQQNINKVIGMKSGKLTIISVCNIINGHKTVKCLCDCGNKTFIRFSDFNKNKSCGKCSYNKFIVSDDGTYVTGIDFNNKEFLFSIEDFEIIKYHTWSISKRNYVRAKINNEDVMMHRWIMQPKNNLSVDHINHNNKDNRRENLRICSIAENSQNRNLAKNNTSGKTGVYYNKINKNWYVFINAFNKRNYIGTFKTIEQAISAREKAEEKFFGKFKNSNDYIMK
jgi:hypothetical protein